MKLATKDNLLSARIVSGKINCVVLWMFSGFYHFVAKCFLEACVFLIFYQGISYCPWSYFGLQGREQWGNDNINCFLILFLFIFFPPMFWEIVEFYMRQHTE